VLSYSILVVHFFIVLLYSVQLLSPMREVHRLSGAGLFSLSQWYNRAVILHCGQTLHTHRQTDR